MNFVAFKDWTVHGRWGGTTRKNKALKGLVVHHTDSWPGASPMAEARFIEQIHRDSFLSSSSPRGKYGMVAYNYLISSDGSTVFEGRGLAYGNGGNGSNGPLGNRNTLSVSFIGRFDLQTSPPGENLEAQIATYYELVDYLTPHFPDGRIPTVIGHRDLKATACPGKRLYAHLPVLAKYVPAAPAPEGEEPKKLSPLDIEYAEAKRVGITDGSNPGEFATRKHAAVMALRASKLGASDA